MTTASFDVPIIRDNTSEGNENFNLAINASSLPEGISVDPDQDQATVTIVDDDGK